MNREEALKKLKASLMCRRDALRAILKGDLAALRALDIHSSDLADYALELSCEEMNSQMAEVETRELVDIDQALKRMSEGGYGVCEDCNKQIPFARLEAVPCAALCIQCQTKLENPRRSFWSEEPRHA